MIVRPDSRRRVVITSPSFRDAVDENISDDMKSHAELRSSSTAGRPYQAEVHSVDSLNT